ncbi:ejaculatory bulb-specific protein 3-like [Diaphorina citri]|uniref:Chemosensory protein 2 n=1 Tax=Diaphorina citri TaxID=121845 RepID=A0A1S3DB94_DIACI|nr:ejaculatory bulb-specific protein 3-like [Diaphorina citri]KAI5752405.1 hypothetical protein M8J77_016695 [Diaphorina citri]QPZ88901.1 chemosensory protein 2 [Diaphorina citri]
MYRTILLSLLASCLILSSYGEEDLEKKYADFDIEAVLNSKRLVTNYVNCLTDKGACSPEGKDLKKNIPTVLQTLCEKCTPSQTDKAVMVIRRLKKDYPEEWKILLEKWDPKGEYTRKFQEKFGDTYKV